MERYGRPIFGTVTDDTPVVQTTHGKISGQNRGGVAVFRGIPYGMDTAQTGRWKAPQPAADWDGVRDCSERNGQISPQFGGSVSAVTYWNGGHPEKFNIKSEVQGEDCLCLNVVTPGLDEEKRPVVVYIHGGGFATGSGSLVLGADPWANEQDIVIVGVNHRLNVFGYLYLGDIDPAYRDSGMAGMLDLVLALQWVRDNIAAFGGDPEKVTIMGESGGGMKVSTLLDMEEARGLFRAAVIESGSGITGTVSKETATAAARRVMEQLKVQSPAEMAALPIQDVLDAWQATGGNMSPVADGVHLMFNETGDYRKPLIDVPVLVGSSEDEIAVFTPADQLKFGWDELKDRLMQGGRWGNAFAEDQIDDLIAAFRRADRKGDDAPHLYAKIVSCSGMLGAGAFKQAMRFAAENQSPVWHYIVAFDSPYEQDISRHYAWHTAELPLEMRVVRYPEESEALSRKISAVWAAFIRNLDPSLREQPWPAFDPLARIVMVIDDAWYLARDPHREIREAIEKAAIQA